MRFPLILVIDDDPVVTRTLSLNLQTDGYDVVTASSGREALHILEKRLPSLAIVDLMLPDIHGFELCRKIKAYYDMPIVMLTAIGTEESIVEGLRQYAEDYIVKPFSYKELLARVARVLRRTQAAGSETDSIRISDQVDVDFARHSVTVNGHEAKLTPTESRGLLSLVRHANCPVPTETLLNEIWENSEGDENRLWVLIKRLRDKIEPDPREPRLLVNERGRGYRLVISNH